MRWIASAIVLAGLAMLAAPAVTAAERVEGAASLRAAAKQKKKLRVIARLKQEAPARTQRAILAPEQKLRGRMNGMGVTRLERLGDLPLVALEVDPQQLEALVASGTVETVQEDRLLQPALTQSIPLIGGGSTAVPAAAAGNGQVIAILDTGVDGSHPFLKGKVLREACFSSNVPADSATSLCRRARPSATGKGTAAPCPSSIATCVHGTHVAGIAAGSGRKFSGVAPSAGLIAIQVFSRIDNAAFCTSSRTCALAYESDIIKGLNHVRSLLGTYKIAAANLSLGGGTYTSACDSEPIKVAIDALRSKGVATVIASGNGYASNAVSYPGCVSSAITVASSTDTGTERISSFANMAGIVDLAAPGQTINSSVPGGRFKGLAGTSMAAPHVAGAWAVMKSADPGLSVSRIEELLEASGRPIKDSRSRLTKPRLDLGKALAALQARPGQQAKAKKKA